MLYCKCQNCGREKQVLAKEYPHLIRVLLYQFYILLTTIFSKKEYLINFNKVVKYSCSDNCSFEEVGTVITVKRTG